MFSCCSAPYRWQTSNDYTTVSCLYPAAYGDALGKAAKILQMGLQGEERDKEIKRYAALVSKKVPSVTEALALADKLLDRLQKNTLFVER